MVWIGHDRSDKFRRDFMAQTFALIAPVRPILHRLWCPSETVPNALKHYEMHENMCFVSHGVYRVRS